MQRPMVDPNKWKRGSARGDYDKVYQLAERIADLSIADPNSGCHLWIGALNDAGYGRIKVRTRFRRAHRVVWELANGPVPNGLCLDHKCRTRACVNLLHLQLVTLGENIRLGVAARSANGDHPFPWTIKHGRKATRPIPKQPPK